ncbi:PQQ-dependent sugar dehydrogenase [Methylibium sp.]|uniref:PQQ-dependent sugar dehydrogenase n=1 Tax=Methylibium sp. TaxID=2067992 RepID=UPI003D0CF184
MRTLLVTLALALLGPFAAAQALRLTPVAAGLQNPWSLAFLPGFEQHGRLLVTERPGRLRVVERDGRLSAPIRGLPPVVARGQGGLLDIALHPGFERNGLVYWSYSEPAPQGQRGNSTAVARGRLDLAALALRDVQVVFRQAPKVESDAHFGSRLVFARDGTLFVTLGDRYSRRADAQTLDNHHGKVVRIADDGSVPADNPFVKQAGALPEIWSYGHRNLQGAALHPASGALWVHEHGPQGGDELNIATRGANHGWPVITQGREYGSGLPIGEGTARADVVPALTTWVPSIAPSGMAFVTGERYPAWRGQLLVGALKARLLVRLELDGTRVVREHRHELGLRVRDVRQGPDGLVYLLSDDDEDGRVWRIEP